MVQNHRYHQLRKDDVEGAAQAQRLHLDCGGKKSKPKFLPLLLVFSIISCSLVFAPHLSAITRPFFGDDGSDDGRNAHNLQTCSSSFSTSTSEYYYLCCDRTGFRSDVCYMSGDIRTDSATTSVLIHPSTSTNATTTNPKERTQPQVEKIKPYTRKWETSVMNTIDELNLVKTTTDDGHSCDVRHTVPAIFFSTGGYTGNVYHEFNDGIIPLYITSKHFNKQVVFVILEYHTWWLTKYGDIISHLSDYPPIDFSQTTTTHCFPSAIAGLHIHDELSINPALALAHPSILDFRRLLDAAYAPRIQSLLPPPEAVHIPTATKPKLVLISRNGSRSITNEAEVVAAAEDVGFSVEVLRPGRTTELAKLYRAVNGSDAVVGVHGAAMTHFLFMRPGTALVQVIPLGTEWAAENYYGGPAVKMGLKYMGYKIWASESSLAEEYKMDDPVLTDPDSVNKKGWEVTKKVYLEGQTVNLNITRFRKRLMRVYMYCVAKRRRGWK